MEAVAERARDNSVKGDRTVHNKASRAAERRRLVRRFTERQK
jgi:hypothetical protein